MLYLPTPRDRLPALVLLFEHTTRSAPSHATIKFLKKHRTDFAPSAIPEIKSSVEEQQLFLELLRLNSSRIPKGYSPARDEMEGGFELSFVTPLWPVSSETIDQLTTDLFGACVECGATKSSRCSQCHAVTYCSRGTGHNLCVSCSYR